MGASNRYRRAMSAIGDMGRTVVDEFGVPDLFFGPHPEEFYSGIGRAVALSAPLEDNLRVLLEALRGADRAKYASKLASGLVAELRDAAPAPSGDGPDWRGFTAFLDRASRAITYRNDLVHNLWPAQADGHLFGHRTNLKTGERLMTTTSMEELRATVLELVALNDEWRTWFAHAGTVASRTASDTEQSRTS